MASQVAALTSPDSKLNQMARTEGLKAANRRGLLNSSMAVGAAQDAVLKNVMPIAERDAITAAGKNAAAKAFEYGMTSQKDTQTFDAETQERDIQFRMSEGNLTREAAAAAQALDIGFQTEMNFLDRALQSDLFDRDIDFRMREGGLDRAAAVAAQDKDIAYRMASGNLDRASAERMQAAEIRGNMQIAALDRATQEKIASWNLSATSKNNVAQAITDVERTYSADYATIMGNTTMSAAARTAALKSIKDRRNRGLNLVEQAYGTNLTW
jgi:hypothetical protein